MAKVIIASPAGKGLVINDFNGTTRGDLSSNPKVSALAVGDVEWVVRPGNVILKDDSSLLPTDGDFNVYLIPTKNKAGMADYSNLGQEIAAAITKAASLVHEDEVEELKRDIIEVVADHFGVDFDDIYEAPVNNEEDGELAAAIAEAKSIS